MVKIANIYVGGYFFSFVLIGFEYGVECFVEIVLFLMVMVGFLVVRYVILLFRVVIILGSFLIYVVNYCFLGRSIFMVN